MLEHIRQYTSVLVVLLLFSGTALASDQSIVIRPHYGFGYTFQKTKEQAGSTHIGARLLLASNDVQRYGLEITKMNADKTNTEYVTTGIILEQKQRHGVLMAIGTVGYLGVGENANNPFGIVTNLGWELGTTLGMKPFITYRSDFIFEENMRSIHSISLGLTF